EGILNIPQANRVAQGVEANDRLIYY
ncbi:hypothetical protein LCGC14_1799320, partial [marine sediment metagenome]